MLAITKKIKGLAELYSHMPSRLRLGASTYYSYRRLIQKTENLSGLELKGFQLEQLKKIVHYSWENIKGYREYWSDNNFSPDKLNTLEDIQKIPCITKEILRDNLDAFSYKKLKKIQKIFLELPRLLILVVSLRGLEL